MGLGATVGAVVRSPIFLENPHKAAFDKWVQFGRNLAANGKSLSFYFSIFCIFLLIQMNFIEKFELNLFYSSKDLL